MSNNNPLDGIEHDETVEYSLDKSKYPSEWKNPYAKKAPTVSPSSSPMASPSANTPNFSFYDTVSSDKFDDMLYSGERLIWSVQTLMPFFYLLKVYELLTAPIMLFTIDDDGETIIPFKICLIIWQTAVLVLTLGRFLFTRCDYAVSDQRFFIKEGGSKLVIPFDNLTTVLVKKRGGREDLKLLYKEGMELKDRTIRNVPDTDRLKLILAQLPKIKVRDNNYD